MQRVAAVFEEDIEIPECVCVLIGSLGSLVFGLINISCIGSD